MQKTKVKVGLFTGMACSMVLLGAAPVWAEGSSHSGTDSTPTTVSTTSDSTGQHSGDGTAVETEQSQEASVRTDAKSLLESERKGIKSVHSLADRQKSCIARQKSFDTRSANFTTAAQRHLDVFNSLFSKVQAFHDSKQLKVDNYDSLVAVAKVKQAAAQAAVDVLKNTSITLDCTSTDPASTVATLKTAVKNARTALHDYRTAIKNVVVGLEGASTAESDAAGGTQ